MSASNPPTRVFLLAAPLIGWALQRLIESDAPRLAYAGQADAAEAASSPQLRSADVVVLATELIEPQRFRTLCADITAKFLLVTSGEDVDLVDTLVMAGARGVVRMTDSPELLLAAIDKVCHGELWIDRAATGRIFGKMLRHHAGKAASVEHQKIATLTARERQLIAAVVGNAAAPGKVIADRLAISEHTLRNHLTSIYGKLGVCNRVDLYAFATRHELNQPASRELLQAG